MSRRFLSSVLLLFFFSGCGFQPKSSEVAEVDTEQLRPENSSEPQTVRAILEASKKLTPLPAGWKPTPLYEQKSPVISKTINGKDVFGLSVKTLCFNAKEAFDQKLFADAVVYSYWATIIDPEEKYRLACYSAVAGDKEAAFYWLQQAAIHPGIEAVRADQDLDLITLRRDGRWIEFLEWLLKCQTYHNLNSKPLTNLILPAYYEASKKRPLNVVIWLHGLGGSPENFVNPKQQNTLAQYFADQLDLAFVGVSGPICIGKKSYVWAENFDEDMQRVNSALDELKGKISVKPGGLIAFGFSQGGQVGMELAARYPEEFAGAIVLSPGSVSVNLDKIDQSNPLLKHRGFVFGCGEEEALNNIRQTETSYLWAKKSGAEAIQYIYPGQFQHTLPKDFAKRFPEWIKFVRIANK